MPQTRLPDGGQINADKNFYFLIQKICARGASACAAR